MRNWLGGIVVAASFAVAGSAGAAEVTISCGWQELELELCRDGAVAWAAESGNQVNVLRGPERSNERYFEYLDLLGRSDRGIL